MSAEHRSCGIGAFLPMSCRGRAEAFARRLQTRLHHLGGTSDTEETEESWLTNQTHFNHPTLHQPRHSTSSESDIYYDFDLESPGSPQEEATESDLSKILLNGRDKDSSLDVESGCVSGMTATSPGSDSSDGNYYDPESFDFPCPVTKLQEASGKVNGHREEEDESQTSTSRNGTLTNCVDETKRKIKCIDGKVIASKVKHETESIEQITEDAPEEGDEEEADTGINNDEEKHEVSETESLDPSTEEADDDEVESDNERINRERQMKQYASKITTSDGSEEDHETYCSTFTLMSGRVIECLSEVNLATCESTDEASTATSEPVDEICVDAGNELSLAFSEPDIKVCHVTVSPCDASSTEHDIGVCHVTVNPFDASSTEHDIEVCHVTVSPCDASNTEPDKSICQVTVLTSEAGNKECHVIVNSCEGVNKQCNDTTLKSANLTVEKKSHMSLSSDEEEEDRPQRVQRCSSLKTGKTPPGTPGRKKIVRFADVLGLDLADIRTFLDEIPKVPVSAYEDLHNADLSLGNNSMASLPRPDRALMPLFQQPGGSPDFLDKVRREFVCLENAMVKDITTCAIQGTVRVLNLDFNKSVHIRYSLDNWHSFCDLQATYVNNSCDGFSDKFSFVLYAHTLVVGQRLEFAVRFQCHGVQYWDSNSGINYIFQCLPPSNPQPFLSLASPEGDRWASFY